ncbi:SMC-Scp complex subunit ScpB [Bacillus oleivorans]|uniref:SMC-Scp complex subunit ScpB n=1 Tax=Bacillus oleivorans TaxID=1448271 RepID=UPI000BE27B72|nr:SMC-Scp complex subunit ScpB [Bacillus oleivorans]
MMFVNWQGIIESLLFAAGDEGLTSKQIASVLEKPEAEIRTLIHEMKKDYDESTRGLTIVQFGDTYELVTKKEFADYLKMLVESPHQHSLSQAALETLAIIAYRQPITRVEIEEIRGVKTERPIQTLMAKGLIEECGRAEGTGRAYLYGTTKTFLDVFGLKDLNELPKLPDDVDDQDVQNEADLFFETFQERLDV